MRKKLSPLRSIHHVERYGMITVGIFFMVAGFYYFLVPVDLVVGGVSGIGLIINRFTDASIATWVVIFNAFLLILAYLLIGKKSFLRSLYGSILYPLFLFIFELTPPLNIDDYLIASIFGGVIVGIGFGIVVRYGGTSGGTDIPVKIIHKYFKLPLSYAVYLVEGSIILIGMLTLGSQNIVYGLYALISIYVVGIATDRMVIGTNSLKTVHTITDYPEKIKNALFERLERGVTVVPVEGGYTKLKKTMLITVITKDEYYILRELVAKIDPQAFVYASPATEIHGDFETRQEDES